MEADKYIKQFIQGHTASKWQTQAWNPGLSLYWHYAFNLWASLTITYLSTTGLSLIGELGSPHPCLPYRVVVRLHQEMIAKEYVTFPSLLKKVKQHCSKFCWGDPALGSWRTKQLGLAKIKISLFCLETTSEEECCWLAWHGWFQAPEVRVVLPLTTSSEHLESTM